MIGAGLTVCAVLIFIVWVLVATVGLGVMSPNMNLLNAARWLIHWRHIETVGQWNLIGAGAGGALVMGLALAVLLKKKKSLHGEARWANEMEIRRGSGGSGFRADRGLILGRAGGKYLRYGGSEHVMLYAPTRAGKGVSVVIPNLLDWADSVVVLDIKRENWEKTAGFRKANGQTVIMFDPLDKTGATACYNPLGHINRADPVECLVELQKIGTMLFPTEGKKDPFWEDGARTGFIGVGTLIAETPSLPFTMGEIYRQLSAGEPKARLARVLEQRELSGEEVSLGCRTALGDFLSNADNTFAGLKQTITSRMGLWVNPRVDKATSASDFDLRTLRSKRTSIYLCGSPDNMAVLAPLYNLFFQQLVDLNTREMPHAERDPFKVLVLLDEFARLGTATVIANGFSYVAGYGLRLMPILQSPSQLRHAYGPEMADEIMANCGVEVIFTPKELKVAQEISDRMGFLDHKALSKSRPSALGMGKRTVTASDQKRALMLPQELMQMDTGQLILLRGGMPPIRGRKITYYNDRDFMNRLLPPPGGGSLKRTTTTPTGNGIEELKAQVQQMAGQLAEIHRHVVVERTMTAEEAAGESPLSAEMVQLALEDMGLELPPIAEASEEEVDAFLKKIVEQSLAAG